MQCSGNSDTIGDIVKLYSDDGNNKSRESVIKNLYKQKIINKVEYDAYIKDQSKRNGKPGQSVKDVRDEEINKLSEQLTQDGKIKILHWVQKVVLDICNVKIHFERKAMNSSNAEKEDSKKDKGILHFELFKKKLGEVPLTSPVSYHCIRKFILLKIK